MDAPASVTSSGTAALSPILTQALEIMPQSACVVDVRDASQPVVWVNQAFELMTGWKRADILGRNARVLQPPQRDPLTAERMRHAISRGERAAVTLLNMRPDGTDYMNELHLEPVRNAAGEVTHYVGLQQDVSQRTRAAAGALAVADAQAATTLLHDRIEQRLRQARAQGGGVAVFSLDVAAGGDDGAGLNALALARGWSLSRLSSRSWVVLASEPLAQREAARIARQLLDAARAGDGRRPCSAGIAMGPNDGDEPAQLLAAAQRARARAFLRKPTGGIAFFAAGDDAAWIDDCALQDALTDALGSGRLALAFVPQVRLADGSIEAIEAQIAWSDSRGPVPPSRFMPVVEASGLDVPLGTWTCAQALATLARLDSQHQAPMRLLLPVTAGQLAASGYATQVLGLLGQHALPSQRLSLLISPEVARSSGAAGQRALADLRAAGVQVVLSEVGRGCAGLEALGQWEADGVRLHPDLVQAAPRDLASAALLRMACELARQYGQVMAADGISTAGQLTALRKDGVPLGQGTLYGPVLPAADLLQILASGLRLGPAPSSDQRQHLLLLDDEPNVLSALKRAMRSEGWVVHAAQSPEQAFEALAAHPIGVVVSDQRMPTMAGTEFLRQVRARYPHTVRVLLTGYTEISTVTSAVNDGAVGKVLSKPWDDDALRGELRSAFSQVRAIDALEHSA